MVAVAQVAEEETTRVCRRCDEVKPIDQFRRHTHGRRHVCRTCRNAEEVADYRANPEGRRWAMIKHRYGIDKAGYEAMLAAQDGRCAICRTDNKQFRAASGDRYAFHIDHDHDTGQIRGLLCFRCNNGIGLLPDSEKLRAAADYLERWRLSYQ